jgi:Immunity protein 50
VETPDIPGADDVVKWFGLWPTFHDAEVLSVHLVRGGRSIIRVHAWKPVTLTDAEGRFIREREAVVVFEFAGIKDRHLEGEDADRQNVISGLTVEKVPDGYRLGLGPCYGLAGEIVVAELTVRVEQA